MSNTRRSGLALPFVDARHRKLRHRMNVCAPRYRFVDTAIGPAKNCDFKVGAPFNSMFHNSDKG